MAATLVSDMIGIREDLSDTIWDVSPTEVPFSSGCKRVSVDNTYFEWQVDELAAVSAAVATEGADVTKTAAAKTVRLGNYTEIIEKDASTSGTLEATNRAGRAKEMTYQIVKRAKEIKRDFEHHLVGLHQAKLGGDARKTGSYQIWISENDVSTAAGYVGVTQTEGFSDGAGSITEGTPVAFAEANLKTAIENCWTAGGSPDTIMCNAFQKAAINATTGNADAMQLDRMGRTVVDAVDVYLSSYGRLSVVPNRFVKTSDVLVYEKSKWKIAVLRGMQNHPLAKLGDSEHRQVLMEAGLMACNEHSSSAVFSNTTS
jgi:hypothetical protein